MNSRCVMNQVVFSDGVGLRRGVCCSVSAGLLIVVALGVAIGVAIGLVMLVSVLAYMKRSVFLQLYVNCNDDGKDRIIGVQCKVSSKLYSRTLQSSELGTSTGSV